MTQERLVIGSRGSDLALFQANFIRDLLVTVSTCAVDIRIIKTMGDKIDQVSFDKMEGKGFFTKELEEALLAREIDLAVHSLKDLMTTQPSGLKLGAVGYRADRREMLLVRRESRRENRFLPVREGAVVGTSSARRKAQIWFHDSSLVIRDLRGNLPTRVKKLRDGHYDAILVAAAGVQRLKLDLSDLDVVLLDPERFLPAPAQGILGIQIRDDDARVESVVSQLGSREAAIEALLERGLLASFDGGCSLPLGVYSQVTEGTFRLKANLGHRDGDQWAGLKWIDVVGSDITTVIAQAHEQLRAPEADCA